MISPQIIIAAVIAILGFGSAWQIQSWRMAEKEKVYAEQKLVDQRHAAETAIRQSQAVVDAQSAATVRIIALRRDADGVRSALVGLSDATEQAMRTAETTHSACLVTADAERVILNQCSERYRSLAETADRHSSDIQTLIDSWPK